MSTAPTGSPGDLYLNTSTGEVYQNVGGTWTDTSASLMGPVGAKGDTGATGANGKDGTNGASGTTWSTGIGAPTTSDANNGDLYMDTATGNVYQVQSGAWNMTPIAGLMGATGAAGADGPQGPKGDTGAAGPAGPDVSQESQYAGLFALAPYLTVTQSAINGVSGPNVVFQGCNVQIKSKTSQSDTSGTGNLIVGWDTQSSPLPTPYRSGSNNLVLGDANNFTSSAASSSGWGNTASSSSVFVCGDHNTASGNNACVNGGQRNIASGFDSSVSGGYQNTASGNEASVSGGYENTASDYFTSVSGGDANTAGDTGSTSNAGTGDYASVSGGTSNTASADYSSVSGGSTGTAEAQSASISGGYKNIANGDGASVSGGESNVASTGPNASVSGGHSNVASGQDAGVSGGSSNTASGERASISGGDSNAANALDTERYRRPKELRRRLSWEYRRTVLHGERRAGQHRDSGTRSQRGRRMEERRGWRHCHSDRGRGEWRMGRGRQREWGVPLCSERLRSQCERWVQ